MNNTALSVAENIIKNTPHTLPKAVLYGVTAGGDTVELGRAPDVYDLLAVSYNGGYTALAVHTTGWAAPLNADGEVDGQPSQHPERRRVALVAVVTTGGMASALSFEDSPEDIVTDEGGATGSLAEALAECFSRLS